jgi:hypothetical protein
MNPLLVLVLVLIACNSNAQLKLVTDKTAFKVEMKQVGSCNQPVPVNWQTSTNKEGSALDLWNTENTMYASYAIFPVNVNMGPFYDRELYNKDPQRSVLRVLSMVVTGQFKENNTHYTDEINEKIGDYQLRSFASTNYKGVVIYRIFPGDGFNFHYIECIRLAITKADLWEEKGELVAGIAIGISCTAQIVQHETPSFPKARSMRSSHDAAKTQKGSDYGYNPQLGTEYCHNPRTGENFRVSPSLNWSETGPDGPGYYGMAGNERIKMSPGRSD